MLPTGSIPAQIHVTGYIAHFPAESKRYGTAKGHFRHLPDKIFVKIG
jgi:hypothetical protein